MGNAGFISSTVVVQSYHPKLPGALILQRLGVPGIFAERVLGSTVTGGNSPNHTRNSQYRNLTYLGPLARLYSFTFIAQGLGCVWGFGLRH